MSNKGDNVDNQVDLTVEGLLHALQDIASRYGGDVPIVRPAAIGEDYEQATAPIILHADRKVTRDGWDLFSVSPTGEAVAVIL